MKRSVAILSVLTFLATPWLSGCAHDTHTSPGGAEIAPACDRPEWRSAVPFLGELTTNPVYGEIWERPQLSKRDRSLVTIASLQALYRLPQLCRHLIRGLDNGLTQEEIQEVITHVSFYTGWPGGVSASAMAGDVLRERGLPASPPASPWVEADGEHRRGPEAPPEYTTGAYAAVPRLGELRNSLLYGDIWERPQLSKRDRSMITVAALQVLYFTNQLRLHIGRALDENGVTPEELSEIILHLTFYAGWPAAVNAGGLAAEAFEERGIPLGQHP